MATDYNREAKNYETLMKKAFNNWSDKKKDTNKEFFKALFVVDNTEQVYGTLTKYDRHFHKTKLAIEKALLKLKKKKKYYNSYSHFTPLLHRLHKAKTPQHLIKIINVCLSKIIRLENQLKRKIVN